jgi:hypothetical protein
METQQMMELLLARMNASMKEHIQEMTARMDANQAEMKADRKADREKDREDLKEMLAEMNAKMDANEASQARMEAKLDASHKKMMAMLDAHHERIMAPVGNMEATDFNANPEEKESIKEQQEIYKEDAAVMPVGEPVKQHRFCNLAMEHHQKRKERTWGYRGSRRKSAAARKVSRRAKVAWRKSNLFRNVQTQRKCRPRKELGTGKRLTHHAEVARRKEYGLQTQVKDNSAPRTLTGGMSRMRRRKGPECKTGIKDPRTRWHLRLQIERTTEEFNRKALGLEFLK